MTNATIHKHETSAPVPRQQEEEVADQRVQIVATPRWVKRIDEWRRRQEKIPTKSEAIRMLVDAMLDELERREGRRG